MIALGLDEIIRAVGGRMALPQESSGGSGVPWSVSVNGLSTDSRTLKPGEVFVALVGEHFDGHHFVAEAFAKGARAAMVARAPSRGIYAPRDEFDTRAAPFMGRGSSPDSARHECRGSEMLIWVDDTLQALARLAAYYRRQLSAKVIAVTGSNGKTTTKGMIDHVLGTCLPGRAAPKSFNNEVGVPLTLLSAEPADRYLVVEIGANAPGEIASLAAIASPDIAVITSLGYAHLEGFGGIEGVVREKLSLFDHVAAGGLGVVNLDDLRTVNHGAFPEGLRTVTYGTDPEADVRVTALECSLEGVTFRINDRYTVRLPVPGAHNARNAAAVFAVARRMQLEPEQIVEALASVRLPHLRLNVRRLKGMTLIEDCYNANPTSMAAGIEVLCAADRLESRSHMQMWDRFSNLSCDRLESRSHNPSRSSKPGRRVLIAGEMKELGPSTAALHEQIGVLAARAGIELLVAVGPGAAPIVDGARTAHPAMMTHLCETTEQACAEVPALLAEGDTVLIKGSRAMGLERLSERIAEEWKMEN